MPIGVCPYNEIQLWLAICYILGRLSLHVFFSGQYLNLRILLECPGRNEAARGAVAATSRTAVIEVSICSGLRSTETITCGGCSKGCGGTEWLAEFLRERKLKRYIIIESLCFFSVYI